MKRNNARVSPDHLTKALHTVTVVTRVATFLHSRPGLAYRQPELLARDALILLGYPDVRFDDPTDTTVVKCVAACKAIVEGKS